MSPLAAACAGINAAIGITGVGVLPVLVAGTDVQKKVWLAQATDGLHFVSFAMTEAGAGSDLSRSRMTAKRDRDTYVINGSKSDITAGTVAVWFTVLPIRTMLEVGATYPYSGYLEVLLVYQYPARKK